MQTSVAEIQGLYGPFTFPEKLLQQIWSRRDFDTASATTADGRGITIIHTGKWNHHGGPDFKNARLRIGDADVAGDVELHLRETDWHAHQHSADPAYANVVLHVVLFPPRQPVTDGAIPILTLLPLLRHDLEEYAADAAIERLAGHSLAHVDKTLSTLPQAELLATLASHAEKRWRQKIHYARLRIERLGWEDACHHTALEILGYSANRAAMLAIATAFPLKIWPHNSVDTIFGQTDAWAAQSTRPANQPKTRLRQYAAWVAARPNWPEILRGFSLPKNAPKTDTVAAIRRALKFSALRKRIAASVCADALGGTRFDTLIVDGFFPLLAAHTGNPVLFELWKNWFVGDMPAQYPKLLRTLEVTGARDTPLHNGAAQGLLGFLIEAEAR